MARKHVQIVTFYLWSPVFRYSTKHFPAALFWALWLVKQCSTQGAYFINSPFPLLQAPFIVVHIARRPPHRDFPLHQVTTKGKRSTLSTCTTPYPSHTRRLFVLYYADHRHSRNKHKHAHTRHIIFMRCYTPVTTNIGSQCSLIHTQTEKTVPCNRGITLSD